MKTTIFLLGILVIFGFSCISAVQEQKLTQLPPPQMDGGMPLMKALKNRRTIREFSDQPLSPQVLSNLLWAAFGINRPDIKKRTAPSAVNNQEIDVYVATADGLYLYDAEKNALLLLTEADVRAKTGIDNFVQTAPVNLVFVANYSKMTRIEEKAKEAYGMADAAFISENVYLFCASEGLATGVRGLIDRDVCSKELNLKPDQHIMLGQSVGYPQRK